MCIKCIVFLVLVPKNGLHDRNARRAFKKQFFYVLQVVCQNWKCFVCWVITEYIQKYYSFVLLTFYSQDHVNRSSVIRIRHRNCFVFFSGCFQRNNDETPYRRNIPIFVIISLRMERDIGKVFWKRN